MNVNLLQDEDRLWLARLEDMSERVLTYKKEQFSQFCDPHAVAVLERFGSASPFIKQYIWGGYSESERRVIGFFPDFSEPDEALFPICALSIKVAGEISHRDILGSVLALGMKRSMIGDIIIDDERCILFCLDSISDYILMNLERIGRQRVEITQEPIGKLSIPPKKFIEISGTVASLRLDAMLSLVTKLSRAKAQELIQSELVAVNWMTVTNTAHTLCEGDTISLRKFGRVEVAEILGSSKKGRTKVVMKRYI